MIEKRFDISQSGRSMIEMLGVLAIVGILSVGGISGYSKAMGRYKISKSVDQISSIAENIRTLYSTHSKYAWTGKNPSLFKNSNVVPSEMWNEEKIENPFGGEVDIVVSGRRNASDVTGDINAKRYGNAFYISYKGIPTDACMEIATMDWAANVSNGLVAVAIGDNVIDSVYQSCPGEKDSGKAIACPHGATLSIPMSVAVAAQACNCNDNCTVSLKFY